MIINAINIIILGLKWLSVEPKNSDKLLRFRNHKKNPRPRGRKGKKRKKSVALSCIPKTKAVIGIWAMDTPSI